MVMYHTAFDLEYFYAMPIDIQSGFWWWMQKITANLFLVLVGISFSLSWNRTPTYTKFLKRGGILIGFGMLISIATWILDSYTFVRFGILHCIGLSIILLPLTARWKQWNVLLGILLISLHPVVSSLGTDTSLLLPLGITPKHFVTLDYFPLVPWMGVILLGVGAGHLLYISRNRKPKPVHERWYTITAPGRYALPIYLLHQPALLLILWMILG